MSDSSPADLAVAFRSLPRRITEARGTSTAPDVDRVLREINTLMVAAGRLVHSTAEADAIADAIEQVHADDWAESDLDTLRHNALDIGRLVRHLATLTETDDD